MVAYWQALTAGHSVLVTDDGAVVEVFPDGTRKFVKPIERRTPVAAGTRAELR